MWRYAILPVLNQLCKKLLFNKLSIVWPIKIFSITFCQEGPQMLCAKFHANRSNRLGGVGVAGERCCFLGRDVTKRW